MIIILRYVFSISLVVFFCHRYDVYQNLNLILRFSFFDIFIFFAVTLLAIVLTTLKWQLLLPGGSFKDLFFLNFIGYFFSLVMPGQVSGEIAKVLFFRKKPNLFKRVSISVLLDRIFGFVGLLALTAYLMYFSKAAIPKMLTQSVLFLFLISLGFVFWISSRRLLHFTYRAFPKFRALSIFKNSLKLICINSYGLPRVILVIIIGMLFHGVNSYLAYFVGLKLGVHVSYFDWVWIFGVTSIILFLPISLGGLGVREGAIIYLLGILNIPGNSAIAISLLLFSINVITAGLGGLIFSIYQYKKENINV